MNPLPTETVAKVNTKKRKNWAHIKKYKALYLMSIPGILYFFIFKYVPMAGSIIAFQDYNIFAGFIDSSWVGFKHFIAMFDNPDIFNIIRNTFIISFYDIIFNFPASIILALLLNELRVVLYKRIIQTVVYMPHFLSWVIISGLFMTILSPSNGIVNNLIESLGFNPIYFFGSEEYTRPILIGSGIWQSIGWGTIIYLAALSGINPELYEAAKVDGANRWQQTIKITLPSLLPTITILFLLQIGQFLDFGFERVYTFLNPLNGGTGHIIDTYIYEVGLQNAQYSLTTAMGLFKSLIGLFLLFIANFLSRKATGNSLY
ncbi:ABC transporter permease subunit [Gracilibacillus salitolerans]|uniref:ABC transporter permease subunit n=1 Tax=Gracilibacillus salitolerans TaxID=2663022 RepID=A0A5Q2TNZ7_9BACI|nr:ABC transporter permease subunit [Gracilibacillus salitolerans]QGH35570.1 ABC transporter permease subunit [Gracilibacillus salitolerans]